MKKEDYLKTIEEYISCIAFNDFKENELLKREYPGVIEHNEKDPIIALEIYTNLKEMCHKYREGLIDSKTFSDFCANTMYSKYTPRVVSKIVSDEIFNALDYISELDFYSKK